MKVRAKALGFHGARRRPGDVFEVPDGAKASWFEPVEPKVKRAKPDKPEAPPQGDNAEDPLV